MTPRQQCKLGQRWPNVGTTVPTLGQRWANLHCCLGKIRMGAWTFQVRYVDVDAFRTCVAILLPSREYIMCTTQNHLTLSPQTFPPSLGLFVLRRVIPPDVEVDEGSEGHPGQVRTEEVGCCLVDGFEHVDGASYTTTHTQDLEVSLKKCENTNDTCWKLGDAMALTLPSQVPPVTTKLASWRLSVFNAYRMITTYYTSKQRHNAV